MPAAWVLRAHLEARSEAHDGQVLDAENRPVAGLYGVGNVAAALHQNIGYAGGAIIGRSMTFGYVAACHAAEASA